MKQDKNLSPLGIAVEKFKKAAKAYDKDVKSGIEYDMMKLIEADKDKRDRFELKLKLIAGIRELQTQYRSLYNDYAEATGKFKDDEHQFANILDNKDSAYNKATELINSLSKITL